MGNYCAGDIELIDFSKSTSKQFFGFFFWMPNNITYLLIILLK